MIPHELPKDLSTRDQLMTRPSADPLPTPLDPKEAREESVDPKLVSKGGQGTDPKAGDIGYTA